MKLTFPHIGNIYIFIKVLFETLGIDYIMPPHTSKRTLELGIKYGPEMACLPLKINLGNFIESIELGADTVIITGGCGPCRFGYYGEMHKEILNNLGYHVKVITIETSEGLIELLRRLKEVFGTYNLLKIARAFRKAVKTIVKVDNLDKLCYKVRPREIIKGSTDNIMKNFKKEVEEVHGYKEVLSVIDKTKASLQNIELDRDFVPLKVGLVGDIYTLIEPFTNINMEMMLGNMGIEVDKSLYISKWINEHLIRKNKRSERKDFDKACQPYLDNPIGGHARESIGNSALYAKSGFDGVIQIYPLTCMPEIVAASVLPVVAKDYNIPILTLIIDEMTGEAGYRTRVEAFADVLLRRREQKAANNDYLLSRD